MDDLQKSPAERPVKTGPGGTVTVGTPIQGQDGLAFVNKDSVTQTPRDRQVTKTDPRLEEKIGSTQTSEPWLQEPMVLDKETATENFPLKDTPWLNSLSSYIAAALELSPMTKTPRASSTMKEELEFAKSGGAIKDDALLSDIETSSSEPHVPTSLLAGLGEAPFGAVSGTATSSGQPQATTSGQLLTRLLNRDSSVSNNSLVLATSFDSHDPKVVTKTLKALVQEQGFSPGEQKFISKMFEVLGEKIAANNKSKGTLGLASGSQALILLTLSTMLHDELKSTSSSSDRVALEKALVNVSAGLSFARMDVLGNTKGASLEFRGINSKDPQEVQKALKSLMSPGLGTAITSADEELIMHLAKLLQERNIDGTLYALRSDNPLVLHALFTSLVSQIPNVTPETTKKIVDILTGRLSAMNEQELAAQLRSTDPDVTLDGLMHKSGLHYDQDASETDRRIIVDYLKVLSNALAFLAQMRASIVQLEGRLTQDTAGLRLGAVNEQLQIANKRYDIAIKKASTELSSLASKIKEAETLKILMPIIVTVIAVIILVVAIASLISAIPTGGVGAVIGAKVIFGLVGAMIGVITAAVAVAVAVTNMIMQFTVGKGMYDAFFDAVAPNLSPLARSGIIMGIELGVAILITIITLGAGAAVLIGGAARIAAQGARMGAEAARAAGETAVRMIMQATIRETMMKAQKELLKEVLKAFVPLFLMGATQAVQAVATSTFTFELVQVIAKKRGATDEEAAKTAMTVQIILTAIFLLAGLLAGGASVGKGVVEGVRSGAKAIGQGLTSLAERLSRLTKEMVKQFFETLGTRIKRVIQDLTNKLQEFLKKPFIDLQDNLVAFKNRVIENTRLESKESISARQAVAGVTEAAVQAAVDEIKRRLDSQTISQTLGKLLQNLAKEMPYFVIDFLQIGAKGLQIGTSAIQIQTAVIQMNLSKSMAEIEKTMAEMEALLNFLTATSKGAASATMQAINESAGQNYEVFKNLVRLFADFIESARAGMRVHDVSR